MRYVCNIRLVINDKDDEAGKNMMKLTARSKTMLTLVTEFTHSTVGSVHSPSAFPLAMAPSNHKRHCKAPPACAPWCSPQIYSTRTGSLPVQNQLILVLLPVENRPSYQWPVLWGGGWIVNIRDRIGHDIS
eukprot:13686721-Ditylum_brightwellii.AAC.1